jgi:hypothetical protein
MPIRSQSHPYQRPAESPPGTGSQASGLHHTVGHASREWRPWRKASCSPNWRWNWQGCLCRHGPTLVRRGRADYSRPHCRSMARSGYSHLPAWCRYSLPPARRQSRSGAPSGKEEAVGPRLVDCAGEGRSRVETIAIGANLREAFADRISPVRVEQRGRRRTVREAYPKGQPATLRWGVA